MKMKVMGQLFRFVPQKKISSFIGFVTKSRASRMMIPFYIKTYHIPTDEVANPLHEYKSLTAFFTRELKKDARKIDEAKNAIISPVDGTISSFGRIEEDTLIQAKGITYSLHRLLGDEEKVKRYENGSYLTIYLSPKDYHRIHVPFDGVVAKSTYIPGRLYPVNAIGVNGVKGLFTKNERMVTYLETNEGEMALVKVGAFIVGSVQVNYPLQVIQRSGKKVEHETFETSNAYQKGQEIGLFEFGSTVIVLFEKDKFAFKEGLNVGQSIKMGELIGSPLSSSMH